MTMSERFTVRPARAEDIPGLCRLLQALFSIETDFIIDPEAQARGLKMLMENPLACILTAETEGSLAGMVTGQLVVSTAAGGYSLLLEDMIVHEKYRGRGIGKALIKTLSAWGSSRGALRTQLAAHNRNQAALNFYQRQGFNGSAMICLYRSQQ